MGIDILKIYEEILKIKTITCIQKGTPKPVFWEKKMWAAFVILLMANVHEPSDSCV